MEEKGARVTEICRNLCVYYKPGKSEDMSCLGSLVVEALAAGRGDLVLAQSAERATEDEGKLVEVMCKRCPFYHEDCDYILKEGDAPPCGGFLALSGFLRRRMITVAEIGDTLARLL